MKPTSREKTISFKEALRIFWDWRQASISVEVCFFCRPGSSENVRVSIDGVVRLVDPDGIVTVSGDGREMDLDLRGCEITHAREAAQGTKILNSLDPDSILQMEFPSGEMCLIFPYRRVGYPAPSQRRPETGMEWMQDALSKSVEDNRRPAKINSGLSLASALATRNGKQSKPRIGKNGPPILPVAAFLLVFLMMVLALTPSSVPKLLVEFSVPRKMSDPSAVVWVIPQDGNYYCSGSVLHGREPGRLMKQGEALTQGYQPALGRYCASGENVRAGSGKSGIGNYFQTVRQGGEALATSLARMSRVWLPQT